MHKMFKDLKKFMMAAQGTKLRSQFSPKMRYFDGLERLNERLHPAVQKLRVTNITKLSHDVTLFRMVSAKKDKPLANFRAGQYIGVKVNINGIHTGRAYSLVSSPNNISYYEIAVKNLGSNGFVSSYLCNELKIGDFLECTEPLGNFYYNPLFHGNKLLFIAGGCGITPFISMLREFYEKDIEIDIQLIYGCLSQKDMLFREELESMASKSKNIRCTFVLSEPESNWNGLKGFITKDIITKVVGDPSKYMIHIVGPDLMRQLLLKELTDLKVPPHRVIWEINPPIQDITQAIGWPKNISKNNLVTCRINWIFGGKKHTHDIKVNSTEPLLNGIERAKLDGLSVENACRAGACAFCRSHLKAGNVFVPEHIVLREVDKTMGYIHPCVSYPISDIEIEIYPK